MVPGQLTGVGSYVKGVIAGPDHGYLVLSLDEMAKNRELHSVLVEWRAGAFSKVATTSWLTAGIAVVRTPAPAMVAVGEYGRVLVAGANGQSVERIGAASEAAVPSPLRGVRTIDGLVYVVGMDLQAYRRDPAGVWSAIDEGLKRPSDSNEVVGFEALDGFSNAEIYAVGWNGAIARFDGRRWHDIDSPTNLILTDVCCADDGAVYACGQGGVIVVGRGDEWGLAGLEGPPDDLWSIRSFQGKIYVCTMRDLRMLHNEAGMITVDVVPDTPGDTFYQLSVADNVMWSIGAKDVLMFDGTRWQRID